MARQADKAVGLYLGICGKPAHRLQADFVGMIDEITRTKLKLAGQLVKIGQQARDHFFLRLWQDG